MGQTTAVPRSQEIAESSGKLFAFNMDLIMASVVWDVVL